MNKDINTNRNEKEWLFGKTLEELQGVAQACGIPKFAARQLADWLYKKQVVEIAQMSNISQKGREALSEKYCVGAIDYSEVKTSKDGTKKYLFATLGNKFIETAFIPDRDRATLCVSSQAGCRMGCKFCMTGRQGFQHHLTAGEILNQIRVVPERDDLTNVVYMGMGEPLDNLNNVMKSLEILTAEWGYAWSPTRITLSTIGVVPALREFLAKSKVHLAVSLHSPFDEVRGSIMPIQNAYPIEEVLYEIKQHDFAHQRRVSFEYILFEGINDSPDDVRRLVTLLRGLPHCRVNLIRFHQISDSPLKCSSERTIQQFKDALNEKGILTTVRASKGEDIFAACGMLSTKKKLEEAK